MDVFQKSARFNFLLMIKNSEDFLEDKLPTYRFHHINLNSIEATLKFKRIQIQMVGAKMESTELKILSTFTSNTK